MTVGNGYQSVRLCAVCAYAVCVYAVCVWYSAFNIRQLVLAGGFPRVLFPPVWCFPPAVSGWGSVWVGLTPRDDLASAGFHDCHQRTVRQPRPTRPRLATGTRPSVPHHHPIRPRCARTTSRPTSPCSCAQGGGRSASSG